MNIYELYPRSWLRPEDIPPGKAFRRRVAGVVVREVRPGVHRPVLSLDPPVNGFSDIFLNRTSAWALAAGLGPETEAWTGQEILVYRRKFGGREGIMVVPAPPPRNQQRKED